MGGHPPPLPPTLRPYVHVRFRARSRCFLQASAGHCGTYLELGKDQVEWGRQDLESDWAGEGQGTAGTGWAEALLGPRERWPSLTVPPRVLPFSPGEERAGSAEGSGCGDRKIGQIAEPGEGSETQNLRSLSYFLNPVLVAPDPGTKSSLSS